MKKIFILCMSLILITGCSIVEDMDNTPNNKVEDLFNKYQTLDNEVLKDLNKVISEEDLFNNTQREDYEKLIKNHYRNLEYEIKEDMIDGDNATVTVEISVIDYSKIISGANVYLDENPDEFAGQNGNYDRSLFITYLLDKLKEADEKVKYTLDITLTKKNDDWVVDALTDVNEEKIHGIYNY